MSTSKGFTLVEVLVALSLSLLVSLAAVQLWITGESTVAHRVNQTNDGLSRRIAVNRFEHDVRMAGVCWTREAVPLLVAEESRLVLLAHSQFNEGMEIVEWAYSRGRVMRRRRKLETPLPDPVEISFADSKTMLEGVPKLTFRYFCGSLEVEPGDWAALALIDQVQMILGESSCGEEIRSRRIPVGR
ncbi:MAG: hypothetical protein Kow00129_11420 [Thermoleophilia bacterium]